MATMYYENDADMSLIQDSTIGIIGYGSQGPRTRSELEGLRSERDGRPL